LIKNYTPIKELKKNVYLVKDFKDQQLVVKVFPKNENEYTSIYLHETEILKKLQHQNIVKIHETEENDDNFFIVFKYIDGENFVDKFANLINHHSKCEYLKIITKILDSLDYIHSHSYIHKDIKPSNILIDHNNNPYILDFGTSTISNTITKTVQQLSLWYASPEQKNNKTVDLSSDLYSFGITLLESLVNKESFEKFTKNEISVAQLISQIKLFDDGKNDEIKNIIKKLTYEDRTQRYQRAKNVISDVKSILSFMNCFNEYELNLSDKVKEQLQQEYNKSPWEVTEYIDEKINNNIKYIKYGKDNQDRDKIDIAINDLLFSCGINSDKHFYVYYFSKRGIEYVQQHGHIVEDHFVITDGNPQKKFNTTYELIDTLERLENKRNQKHDEYKEKRSFLDKTDTQLKIERAILDKKNISLYAKNVNHKKGKKELIVDIVNLSNVKIKKEHLKIQNQEEQFVQKLFEDGFIDDPNNQEILETLNSLIQGYFFERERHAVSKRFYGLLNKEQKNNKNIKAVEEELVKRYSSKTTSFEKLSFNAQILFHIYPNFLIKQKEEETFFSINDDVIINSIDKRGKFNEKFSVYKIDAVNKRIILTYEMEISKIPDELQISFDYDRNSGVLNKQEYSIKDLKNNNTTIENLLSKIANPKSLAPKRTIPSCKSYTNDEIDENQKEAVDKALSLEHGEYLVVQGPPGTGKTTVITEIINQILANNKLAKILVTSQSNQAVDNVLEKICVSENKIVRFGNNKNKLSNIAQKYHEDTVFDNYVQDIKKSLNEDEENYFLKSECLHSLHDKWKNQVLQGDKELKTLLFKKIRVIFGTLVGISSWQDFRNIEFDYIIVDEAGRATLPELMIPLRRGKRFILVGDHKQLPPIVDDDVLKQMDGYNKKDLETTLFEELYDKIVHNDFKHFLKYNYRSDKNIAKLYSDTFYESQIETRDFIKREHNLSFDKKVYFYSTSKLENRFDEQAGTGKKNNLNRDKILDVLEEIQKQAKDKNIKKSIGVITPYLAQRDNIRSQFGHIRNKFDMLSVDINSVDAFQGSDRDIIIYDIVRSQQDTKSNIEFISDEKRLNVALSRTKELLFIIGDADFIYNASTKEKSNPFKKIIELLSKDKMNYQIKEL